jgi:hypothetical protein
MSNDEEHLKLLSIFHFVMGGMIGLFSCIPFIHVGVGIAMLVGAFGHGHDAPPPALGLLFICLGGSFIVLGWTVAILLLVAGQRLRKRRSYKFCFVVAAISCAFAPMGTVLGVLPSSCCPARR